MRIAILGGTGTLGRAAIDTAVAAGHDVVAISRRAPGRLPPGVAHAAADVTTGDGLARALAGAEVLIDATNARRDAGKVLIEGTRRVLEAAQGPLRFYVEIHGNNRREAAQRIEIATVGTDKNDALRLKTLLELIRDAHLRARPGSQRLDVLVEPADPVMYGASSAKRVGILRLPAQALHIELPKAARVEGREVYTAILADFLTQAAILPR